MKSLSKYIFVLCAIALFAVSSCDTDNDITPDQDVRASYLGTWLSTEQSGMTYSVNITLDPANSTQIYIGNFHFLGANEKAYAIATSNNLTFPSQVICGNTIHGLGNLVSNNKITLKYYVNNQTDIDTINATYTK